VDKDSDEVRETNVTIKGGEMKRVKPFISVAEETNMKQLLLK
jgi:hypothetical protein